MQTEHKELLRMALTSVLMAIGVATLAILILTLS